MIELKLDGQTMFEWQRHSQESIDVPPYKDLLAFINLRAQASESSSDLVKKTPRSEPYTRKYANPPRHVASHSASLNHDCVVCKEKHPLYLCTKYPREVKLFVYELYAIRTLCEELQIVTQMPRLSKTSSHLT